MRRTRSLLISPFEDYRGPVLKALSDALSEIGVEVLRFDEEVNPGASWANVITAAVRSADFVVVDVTRQNPNVFYELGFAHALRKPTILIASTDGAGAIPSVLAGFQFIVYEPSNLPSLVHQVQRAARAFVGKGAEPQ
jgi:hypothetical protein